MTVDEFYEFTDRRPDEEKWELIDGEPILNAAPSALHQWIVRNVLVALTLLERERSASWAILPSLGVRVSETNRPEPDLVILPRTALRLTSKAATAVTRSRPSKCSRHRPKIATCVGSVPPYTSLASLTHYVVIAQDGVEVVVFPRDNGFAERRLRSLSDSVEVPAFGITLPLAEIYRGTGLENVSRD
jgi:hypothetical protein